MTDAAPLSRDDLIGAMSKGAKPKDQWRIGAEHDEVGTIAGRQPAELLVLARGEGRAGGEAVQGLRRRQAFVGAPAARRPARAGTNCASSASCSAVKSLRPTNWVPRSTACCNSAKGRRGSRRVRP